MPEKGQFLKNSFDIAIATAVIIVVLALIIPVPAFLLDFLMACNVLLSVLIILIVVFSQKAVDFSSFPTVLLFSTVFGLGINVSSTRLILAKGVDFDGRMVRAFASFVVSGGNGSDSGTSLVIGVIIFIIIIAVQTFVITKGASRIAEVAARFTLDGMPMKQAAVEAEYNSGAITQEEAQKKKREVQREADFYGAMDGASKFVSGNVKVGIFITVINLVAGFIIGMVFHKEPFAQAIQTYPMLTIGDGLLSQLPSLLVSFASGLIVTRSASDGTLGTDIKTQFSNSAWIYIIAGITMAIIGVLPGFPWYILIPMGAALGYLGFRLYKTKQLSFDKKLSDVKAKQQTPATSGKINPVVPLDTLSLELGYTLIPLVDKEKGAELLERVTRIRREAGLDMGLVVPSIRIIDNMRLEPNQYCFKLKGVEVGKSHIRMGWFLCMNTGGVTEELSGEKTTDPAFGLPAIWIPENMRDTAERAGYAVVDPPTIIATHLTEIIKRHAAELLGRQEVTSILEALKPDYSAVVDEVTKLFTAGEIQKVMQGLLLEQVSIRNTITILETMADFGGVSKKTSFLIEKVRQALGRQICLQYAYKTDEDDSSRPLLRVITVEQPFLQKLVDSRVDTVNGPIAALDPVDQRSWIASVQSAVTAVQNKGFVPIILCPEETRILVKSSTDREIPSLVVLSVPEIATDIKIESLGEITIA